MSTDAVMRAEAEDDREFDGLFARHVAWRTLLGSLFVALLVVVILERLAPAPSSADLEEPAGWSDVKDALRTAAADPAQRVVLVLGDSVLRPNVMREAGVEDAAAMTPVAWARRLADADVAFYDLSLDGMLPADMLTIVAELDGLDPEVRIELVIELSPRYLSPDYANPERAHARAFLDRPERHALDPTGRDEPLRLVHHRLGLVGVRRALGPDLARPERALLGGPRPVTDAATMLRVARHFLAPVAAGAQVSAIDQLVAGAAHRGRRVLFFTTPVNGRGLGQMERSLPATRAAKRILHGVVAEAGDAREGSASDAIRFRDLDDDLFPVEDFLDHVHLRPAANARLAARILRALEIPTIDASSRSRRSGVLAPLGDATSGIFLDRDRVLLSREDHPSVLLDLASGLRDEEGAILPAHLELLREPDRLLYWRRVEGEGRIGLFERFAGRERECGRGKATWPFAEPPRFDLVERTMVAVSGRLLHRIPCDDLHAEVRIEATIELPEELRDATPRIGPRHLFLAPPQPDAGTGHLEIRAILITDLEAGRLDRFEVFARCAPDPAWERDLVASGGLRQKNRDRLAMPFPSFRSFRVDGDALVIEAPLPGAPGAVALWWLPVEAGVVQALLEPAADGFVLGAEDASRDLPRRVLAYHAPSGRALVERRAGLEIVETDLVHRSDWIYGSPPWPEEDIVVANGFSHRRRRPGNWRVGLFGSSRVGASYPGLVPDSRALMSSLSLATELGRELDRLLDDSARRAQALDFSQARSDLLRCLATLQEVPDGEIQLALVSIDDESLRDPDRPGDVEAPRLPGRYRAIRRDAAGKPLIELQAGFRPRLVFDEFPEEVDERSALADCVAELAGLARSRGIRLVVLDLADLHEKLDPGTELLRATIRAQGVPLLDARALVAREEPGLAAFDYGKDPHLRPGTIRALARALGRELEEGMRRDLFRLGLGERGRETPTGPRSLLPRGARLDALAARRHDVAIERSLMAEDASGVRLVYDLGPEPEVVPNWRRALALLGLRGAPRLDEGTTLRIEIIRFEDYDEYGMGSQGAPERIATYVVSAADLEAALEGLKAALEAAGPPPWLRTP